MENQEEQAKNSSQQSRRWFFTINNPTQTDEELTEYIQNLEHFKYAMFQREKGTKEGTIHIQAFIIFSIGKRFSTIKNLFPDAHIEAVKGTNAQARDYCSKSDTRVAGPYELGTFAEERSRTDIKNLLEMIENGATNEEIKKCYPNLYFSNFEKLDKLRQEEIYNEYKDKLRNLNVTYLYGEPGIGKSRYIFTQYKYSEVFRVTNYDKSMFDNYQGQKVIVFEEFDSQRKITDMLNFLDIYPLSLPCRYNNKMACYEKVFILSNKKLSEQYENIQSYSPSQFHAFLRRIHNVIRMDDKGMHYEKQTKLIELKG